MRPLFDTEKYISTVKAGGVGDDEAHAMSDALIGALNEGVATNDELVKIGARIDLLTARVDVLDVRVEVLSDKIDGQARSLNDKIDGQARSLNDKIDGVARSLNDKIDNLERNLRTEMDARFHIHKVWLMIIAAMVAFSNPLMMHFYEAMGLFP